MATDRGGGGGQPSPETYSIVSRNVDIEGGLVLKVDPVDQHGNVMNEALRESVRGKDALVQVDRQAAAEQRPGCRTKDTQDRSAVSEIGNHRVVDDQCLLDACPERGGTGPREPQTFGADPKQDQFAMGYRVDPVRRDFAIEDWRQLAGDGSKAFRPAGNLEQTAIRSFKDCDGGGIGVDAESADFIYRGKG